jgi:RNA polymerase sigma-70 factor (ECF subfamily)
VINHSSEDLRSLEEPALIGRVLAGDPGAFRPLVEAYERAVFGLCRKLLDGNDTEAEDMSQETFLRAYQRLGELKDHGRFGPWLYQIARSLCRDRVRSLLAERRAMKGRLELERLQAAGEAGGAEIGTVLDDLPEAERRVLELRYFEGLSYRDVARSMNLSFSRVDHLIRQARARLSRRLAVQRRHERSL